MNRGPFKAQGVSLETVLIAPTVYLIAGLRKGVSLIDALVKPGEFYRPPLSFLPGSVNCSMTSTTKVATFER
jgi:hypothetical protein